MTIGSLFSGIGGLERGLELAGLGPVLWQCEIDPFCRAVLAKHWPDATRYTDVRTLRGSALLPVDILCGGFPCQDISHAGKRVGLDGERSGLWYEFARLIEEIRPQAVVIENVRGLVGGPLDTVAGRLTELGYAVEATRILAADLGAPHLRERIFIVAYTDSHALRIESGRGGGEGGCPATLSAVAREGVGLADSLGEGQLQPQGTVSDERRRALHRSDGVGQADSVRQGLPRHGGALGGEAQLSEQRIGGGRSPESSLGERADGLSGGLAGPGPRGAWPAGRGATQHAWEPPRTLAEVKHRPAMLKALGNAVCPQQAYVVGLRVREVLARMAAA